MNSATGSFFWANALSGLPAEYVRGARWELRAPAGIVNTFFISSFFLFLFVFGLFLYCFCSVNSVRAECSRQLPVTYCTTIYIVTGGHTFAQPLLLFVVRIWFRRRSCLWTATSKRSILWMTGYIYMFCTNDLFHARWVLFSRLLSFFTLNFLFKTPVTIVRWKLYFPYSRLYLGKLSDDTEIMCYELKIKPKIEYYICISCNIRIWNDSWSYSIDRDGKFMSFNSLRCDFLQQIRINRDHMDSESSALFIFVLLSLTHFIVTSFLVAEVALVLVCVNKKEFVAFKQVASKQHKI